jgi:N-acetyl sugar amidotransferase
VTSRQCTRCVMDTSDPTIAFDARGVCSHCRRAELEAERPAARPEVQARLLDDLLRRVREDGRGREYDCVIGLSGGADSSWLAYLVKRQFGLRPLAVHLDNGWNSEIAARNIQKLVRKLDIDLVTHVVEWEEFRDLQRAYLQASVIDIEGLTDHAIQALLYRTADEHRIPHILLGGNRATELILPIWWGFSIYDATHIRDLHGRFGQVPLKTFPLLGTRKLREYVRRGISMANPLDWVPYVKAEAKATLTRELGWADYGGKHAESLFTKFYQGYILVEKFKVDKRRAHLSSLIASGQITRQEALEELARPPYPPAELQHDLPYVVKKLGFTAEEFARIMATPPRSHFEYATETQSKLLYLVYPRIKPWYRELRRVVERALPEPIYRELQRRVERLLPP